MKPDNTYDRSTCVYFKGCKPLVNLHALDNLNSHRHYELNFKILLLLFPLTPVIRVILLL